MGWWDDFGISLLVRDWRSVEGGESWDEGFGSEEEIKIMIMAGV